MPPLFPQHVGYAIPDAPSPPREIMAGREVPESPFTRSKSRAKTAVISIDLGMTATRAELASLEKDPQMRVIFHVPAPSTHHLGRNNFGPADFANQVEPFGESLSAHFVAQGEAISIPIKSIIYIDCMRSYLKRRNFSMISDILDQIPQLYPFWEVYLDLSPLERDNVFQRLLDLLRHHLNGVKKRGEALAREKDMRITTIVATAPGNWDSVMWNSYTTCLLQVWKSSGLCHDDIYMIGEADALAHWLVLQKPEVWLLSGKYRSFLIGDFGGHTLNIYRFNVHLNEENNSFCYFALGNGYTTHHGGSNVHEALVRDEMKFLIMNDGLGFSPQQRATLLDSAMRYYRNERRGTIDGRPIVITAELGEESTIGPIQYRLDPRKCREFYDKAFKDLLEIFSSRVDEAASEFKNVRILALGGSFENNHLLMETKRIVAKAGLEWDDSRDLAVDTYLRPSIVARGAALGFQSSVTASQFVKTSTFSMNTRQTTGNDIPIIMHKGTPIKTMVKMYQRGLAEVSCAPWKVEPGVGCVDRRHTYVVRILSLAAGDYQVWLELTTEMPSEAEKAEKKAQDYLVFSCIKFRRGPTGVIEEEGVPQTYKWPIYFDEGQRLILVDRDLLGEGATHLHESPPSSTKRSDSLCYTIRNPVALGNWGSWELSLNRKAEVSERRRTRNRTEN